MLGRRRHREAVPEAGAQTAPEAVPADQPQADYRLDVRGEHCPYPVIYTLEALSSMSAGEVLEVVADCPQSFRNVPEEAVKHGYTLVRDPVRRGAELYFLLRA